MASLYRHSKIWLSVPFAVEGWTYEELKKRIEEYNKFYYKFSTFWEWLSYEEGRDIKGFDCLWNEGNPLLSRLPIIRATEAKGE